MQRIELAPNKLDCRFEHRRHSRTPAARLQVRRRRMRIRLTRAELERSWPAGTIPLSSAARRTC